MYSICNNREECVMRHENGNCLPIGGFCTAVNDAICDGLHMAFDKGYIAGRKAVSCCDSCSYVQEQNK